MRSGKTTIREAVISLAITAIFFQGCQSAIKPTVTPEQLLTQPRITEFILGPGDKVDISVLNNDELKTSAQIDISGKIIFPLLGDVQAGGLSIFQLRDKIRDGLSAFLLDPQVSIQINSSQSQKVVILGEVKNPGYFQVDTSISALEAISRAGGYTVDGKMESVVLIRGAGEKPQLALLNLDRALKEADLSNNVMLQRGDILYVPRTAISDVDKFMGHASTILSPIIQLETGIFLYRQLTGAHSNTAISP